MTSPEGEILARVAERVEALLIGLDEAIDLAGPVPADLAAFEARSKIQRVASKGLLKTVEQLEEQVARLFRTILRDLAVDLSGWYAQDIANEMQRLGIVDDAAAWVGVIKLRNRLVHDYPLDRPSQYAKLAEAYAAAVLLRETAVRTLAFLRQRGTS